jgi:hypothetical protein
MEKEETKKLNRRVEKLERRVTEVEKFKPTFYGFTGGVKKDESMAEFVKRINKEGVRQ